MGGNIFQHSQDFVTGAFRPDLLPSVAPATTSGRGSVYFDEVSQLGTWALSVDGLEATSSSAVDAEAGIRLNTSIDSAAATYVEFLIVQGGAPSGNFGFVGIGLGQDGDTTLNAGWWYTATGYLLWANNAYVYHNSAGGSSGLAAFNDGDVVRMCVRAGKLYWGLNSSWIGDPSAQTGALYSDLAGNYFPGLYGIKSTESVRIRLRASDMSFAVPTGCSTILP